MYGGVRWFCRVDYRRPDADRWRASEVCDHLNAKHEAAQKAAAMTYPVPRMEFRELAEKIERFLNPSRSGTQMFHVEELFVRWTNGEFRISAVIRREYGTDQPAKYLSCVVFIQGDRVVIYRTTLSRAEAFEMAQSLLKTDRVLFGTGAPDLT
jgi:hypothetical protein